MDAHLTPVDTLGDVPALAVGSCERESCWICLLDEPVNELEQRCRCPRRVHARCLARWNLQSAGRAEEKTCRFCGDAYPDWKPAFRTSEVEPSAPVMSIHFNGEVHMIRAASGHDGQREFQARVCELLRLDEGQTFDITFDCRVPGSESRMALRGLGAYDAAVYCASVTAAERMQRSATRHRAEYGNGPVAPRQELLAPPAASAVPSASRMPLAGGGGVALVAAVTSPPARITHHTRSAGRTRPLATLPMRSANHSSAPTPIRSASYASALTHIRSASHGSISARMRASDGGSGALGAPRVQSALPTRVGVALTQALLPPPRFAMRAVSSQDACSPLHTRLYSPPPPTRAEGAVPPGQSASPAAIPPIAALPSPPRFAERASAPCPSSPLHAGLAAASNGVMAVAPAAIGLSTLHGAALAQEELKRIAPLRHLHAEAEFPHKIRSWARRLLSI